MLDQKFKYGGKDSAVVNIAGRDFCFRYTAPPAAEGMRLAGKAFPLPALSERAAVRAGGRLRYRLLLCRCEWHIVVTLFRGFLPMR